MITSLNLYRTSTYFAGQRNTVCIDKNLRKAPNTKFDNLLNYGLLIENLDGTTYKIFDEYIDVKAETLQANSNYLLVTYARLEYDYEDGEMPFVKYYRINRIEDRPNIIRLYWELDTFMTYWQYTQSTFNETDSLYHITRTNLLFRNELYKGDIKPISTKEPVQSISEGLPYVKFEGTTLSTRVYDFVIVLGLKYVFDAELGNRKPNQLKCIGFPIKVDWSKSGNNKPSVYETLLTEINRIRTIYEYKVDGSEWHSCQLLSLYVVPSNLINIAVTYSETGTIQRWVTHGTAHILIPGSTEQTIQTCYELIPDNRNNYIYTPSIKISPNLTRKALKIGMNYIELPNFVNEYYIKVDVGMSENRVTINLELPDYNSIDISNYFEFPIIQNNTETTEEEQNRILQEALGGISIGINLLAGAASGGAGLALGAISAGQQIGGMVAASNENKINRQLSNGGGSGQIGLLTYMKLSQIYGSALPINYINVIYYQQDINIRNNLNFYYSINGAYVDIYIHSLKDLPTEYLLYDSDTEEQPLAYMEFDTQLFGIPNDYINDIKDIINNGVYIKWL